MSANPLSKNEKLTLWVSLIALFFSVASGLFSTYYTIRKDHKDDLEVVDIVFTESSNDKTVLYKDLNIGKVGSALIPLNYNILVSNNSKRTVSIIDHKLTQTINGKMFYYSNIVNKVTINNKDIDYPVAIEAGESIKLVFSINILLKPVVDDLIQKKYKYDTKIPFSDLHRYLLSNGYDLYGNKLKAIFFEDNTYMTETEDYKTPTYKITFTTSTGSKFTQSISEKDLPENF
ncbi:hypothetical protein C2I18_19070 [Paenibacillus sp. PK3_47]|uniref:hypothetical protein n=1 Tax=Paenibacillus sp. PK3_47 TaxID=2072642 RepID=UPI00201E219D|nr:hypothetical protein [Paenibacillus sp. PK3_47]UQZ35440.1 hypothetical protein C2I18_19070 [Paenibacillus sp. PK3_47]